MKKKKKFHIKSRHLLVIMTFVCISAIALTVTKTVSISPVREAAGMLIVPFQNGINSVGSWLSEKQRLPERGKACRGKTALCRIR